MGVLAPLIALIVGITLMANVSDFFVSSRETSKQNFMAMTKLDVAREMGPIVRNAYDMRLRGACPSGTTARNSVEGIQLCWRTLDNGCIRPMDKTICLASGFVSHHSSPIPWYLKFLGVENAYAQRAAPWPTSPRGGVASGNGVWVGAPIPGPAAAATTFSPVCGSAGTVCITMDFCLGEKDIKVNGCASTSPIYIRQTFAIWNF
ncbi:hypothetical protein AZI86_16160 [Bdellovibrio bacteriovorus]|uniref:Uncharacterized protein n=1 Tax=Bdellovibrio bacteriovorus TaxID=959 RepID=A0A150WHB8_BDEBC|nr:hypothetical protein [Bdellovibrio bacteriovorus]KYG62370.1 hypothetical protein AZI86_16160 [Bdellovibrio bacteriovorus]